MKLLKIGYEEIKRQLKILYKKTNNNGAFIYTLADSIQEKIEIRKREKALYRILSGIQVSWAEESIKRLLYEPNLFTDLQRDYLLERPALDQKWYQSLHITFCIAYDLVPINDPTCVSVNINGQRWNLGDELVDQYYELRRLITEYLVPNFSIRNKVQHGEWEYAFKPKHSKEISTVLTAQINHESIVTTTSRFTLVNAFYQLLVDLGRFKSNSFALDSIQTPFEYFYNDYMKKIKFETRKIANPELEKFISEIVNREIRGRTYQNH